MLTSYWIVREAASAFSAAIAFSNAIEPKPEIHWCAASC